MMPARLPAMAFRGWCWRVELPNARGNFTRMMAEFASASAAADAARRGAVAGWRLAVTESAHPAQAAEFAPC